MNAIYDYVTPSALMALIYALGTIGLLLIYKYLTFPDFTTIGSLLIGGVIVAKSVSAVPISSPLGLFLAAFVSVVFATIAGALLGAITAFEICRIRLPAVLAGIATNIFGAFIWYVISGNEATQPIPNDHRPLLDWILSSEFTWGSAAKLIGIVLLTLYLINTIFSQPIGKAVYFLRADENYLRYRHSKRWRATAFTLILGNAIIALAGALGAIVENQACFASHFDFLVVGLGAYGMGSFFILLARSRVGKDLLTSDPLISRRLVSRVFLLMMPGLNRFDDQPARITCDFAMYSLAAVVIYVILRAAELAVIQPFPYLVKAGALIAFMGLGVLAERVAKIKV